MVSSCNSRKHCVLEICSEFIRESLVVFRRKNMPVSSKKIYHGKYRRDTLRQKLTEENCCQFRFQSHDQLLVESM